MDLMLSPAPAGSAAAVGAAELPPLHVEYSTRAAAAELERSDVLAVIGFGGPPASADPRHIRVALEPALAPAPVEVWRGSRPISRERDGALCWSSDGHYACVVVELLEAQCGGIANAARTAYALLAAWCAHSATPHLLRLWNYIDAINLGDGDEERYRQFCSGRAAGMDAAMMALYPAASAIGVRDGQRLLQVCALAASRPGTMVENPRQVSAWRYPRQYGPVAPGFSRAMRSPAAVPQLYISGTAAVVGHRSHHNGDIAAQLEETLANLESLRRTAGGEAPLGGPRSLLKAYIRHAADADFVRERLLARLGLQTPLLLLLGDICRSELVLEIDGLHNG
jgi:chorismate lyase/3-hydroxybenzoate synthase